MPLPIAAVFLIDLLAFIGIFAIIALSLNLEFGYMGIPNFGKLLAVAGGAFFVGAIPGRILAYAFGVMNGLDYIRDNLKIVSSLNQILSSNPALSIAYLILSLIGAALAGAILGYIASYPAIRLREDYLAITLLAMAEILRTIGYNWPDLIGGTKGIPIPDPFRWISGELRILAATVTILATLGAVLAYMELVSRSPLGRVLRAIRDNELSAETYGKDIVKFRMKTLMVGSAIAAIGGALYTFWTASVTAAGFHRVTYTFWPWVMVIVGGAANNFGALVGAGIFVTLRKIISFYKSYFEPYVPFDVVWLEYLFLGLALIIVLMYRPEGLIPEKPTRTLSPDNLQRIISKIRGSGEASKEG